MRSPVSQLTSWIKAPYFLDECVRAFQSGKPASCKKGYRMAPWYYKEKPVKWDFGDSFTSISDVYSRYLRFYKYIQEHKLDLLGGCFKSVTLMTYEDLVLNTEKKIAEAIQNMGWSSTGEFQDYVDSAKIELGNGKLTAIKKIQQRTYLTNLTRDDRARFCSGVDLKECAPDSVTISDDCV